MNFSKRFYGISLGAFTLLAAVFAVLSGGWDIYDRFQTQKDKAAQEVPSPAPVIAEPLPEKNSASDMSSVMARLDCEELVLSDVQIDPRETPAAETESGQQGYYMTAQLNASLEGQTRPVSAEGNGKGPGSEARAKTMLVENLTQTIKTIFPEC